MAQRLMQIVVPESDRLDLEGLLEGEEIVTSWEQARSGDLVALNVLVQAEAAEPVMDRVEERFGQVAGFRLLLYPLEAVLPRGPEPAETETEPDPERSAPSSRVSREELYLDVSESMGSWRTYAALITIAVVVAAIGLLRDDLALIIAAMVIAPLLGPNVALALATTLGDSELAGVALRRALLGVLIALALSVAIGRWAPVDPEVPAIAARTRVSQGDLVLGLAAGAAGTLAFTSSASSALVGVMVAVALMPPLVVFGMLLGAGERGAAAGAAFLVAANLVCLNLACISTFLLQGVRPREWFRAVRASRTSRWGLLLWLLALIAMSTVLLVSQYRGDR